ncbi:hypothetical protein K491DRAFT_493156 [Lophiostoma macrostomum CBS 122681]|uniref:Uncharacterized protein n=1 Tax=Lophiostoma macrostomum CBS 122681 TaxID=1314788 RepID=A0A6A6T510_9PLEO|nr:hypothetical protein K491DRAFT_493156 [Lophiostoma macrostomum CBS 122681]
MPPAVLLPTPLFNRSTATSALHYLDTHPSHSTNSTSRSRQSSERHSVVAAMSSPSTLQPGPPKNSLVSDTNQDFTSAMNMLPGENHIVEKLFNFYRAHDAARRKFQGLEIGLENSTNEGPMRQATALTPDPFLEFLLGRIGASLMSPSPQGEYELIFIVHLLPGDLGDLFLRLIYEGSRRSLPAFMAATTKDCASEAVLGWASFMPSTLPIAEAAILAPADLIDRHASSVLMSTSLIVNALTVSPGQGQLEWLALAADAVTTETQRKVDLAWYAVYERLNAASCNSLVMDEALMTETTFARYNELYSLLTGAFVLGTTARVTYEARRNWAEKCRKQRLTVAYTVRTVMRRVHRALRCDNPGQRVKIYESWLKGEWDAPSILFPLSDIRQIVVDLDADSHIHLLPDEVIETLVLRYRGLRAVCARARSLSRRIELWGHARDILNEGCRIETFGDLRHMLWRREQLANLLVGTANFPHQSAEELDVGGSEEAMLLDALRSSRDIRDSIDRIAEGDPTRKLSTDLVDIFSTWESSWDAIIQDGLNSVLHPVRVPMVNSFSVFEGKQIPGQAMVGTTVKPEARPRVLWDLVFNTTIEAEYTWLPWIAVSHSWKQAAGSHYCSINERKNIIPWATRAEINNVREAILQLGFTVAWMDKICLRQRGRDGIDSAQRISEWATDIPLMDIAYQKAAKILVYLEGAGKPMLGRQTFRAQESWLHRKWTAQEIPQGVPVVIGNGSKCLQGDFETLCEQAILSWHSLRHKSSSTSGLCRLCEDIRSRFRAIHHLRILPQDPPELDLLTAVWHLVRGRSAGCEADHVFSLLSLLRVYRRPLYNPKYTRDQAVALVKDHLSEGQLAVLADERQAHLFEGMFSKVWPFSRKTFDLLSAFRPDIISRPQGPATGSVWLHGSISEKMKAFQAADIMPETGDNLTAINYICSTKGQICWCQKFIDSVESFTDIHIMGYFFLWHGQEYCCVANPNTMLQDFDKEVAPALAAATHLLLSEDRFICVLLRRRKDLGLDVPAYDILELFNTYVSTASQTWTRVPPSVTTVAVMVHIEEANWKAGVTSNSD